MRSILLACATVIALSGSAFADTIKVSVNGLVCGFCATAIEKTFKAQPEVHAVKVDLEKKLVTIDTNEGKTLKDAKIKKLITDAGYSVTTIVSVKAIVRQKAEAKP